MNKHGFTLVEVISVIALLGLIIGLAVPGVMRSSKKAKERTLNAKIKNIEKAAVLYGQDNKRRFTITNKECDLCEKSFELDNITCNGDISNGKCYINNCFCFDSVVTVGDLAEVAQGEDENGDILKGYIKYDDENDKKIFNSTDESKYLNNCEIQIYQKYGKIYAVYLNKNVGTDCWIQS